MAHTLDTVPQLNITPYYLETNLIVNAQFLRDATDFILECIVVGEICLGYKLST